MWFEMSDVVGSSRLCSQYVSAAFGSLDLPWKPGHLRSAYGAICCHKFKPKNQTDDIFLAQILGHKLLGPNASLSVGKSYASQRSSSTSPNVISLSS